MSDNAWMFDGLPCKRNDCRLQHFYPASVVYDRLGETKFDGVVRSDVRCLTCRRHWTVESHFSPNYECTWVEWFATPAPTGVAP